MTKWKKVDFLEDILTKEGFEAYSFSEYYVYKHVNLDIYRITIHDNPHEKSNIVRDNVFIEDIIDFFDEVYEEDNMIEE